MGLREAGEVTERLPLFWRVLEAGFQRAYRMEPVHPGADCLLAFNRFAHAGADVTLQCGSVIRRGDACLEIHFRREALLPLMRDGNPARMGIGLVRLGDRDIPRLVRRLEQEPGLREIRAAHALTLFHRGITRYGFEVQPMESPATERWFTWWHRLLMSRDHADGREHVRQNLEKLVTRHVWASRETLLRRYGASNPGAGARI
jgi:hypothetical protein